MTRDRSAVAVIGAIVLSVLLLLAGLVFSPIYLGNGYMEGDWCLSYVEGYGPDGDQISEMVADPSWDMYIEHVQNGTVKGSLHGDSFSGAADGKMMRFQIDSPQNIIQMIGCLYVPEVLTVSAVIYDKVDDSVSSYNLTFTRDRTVPHMIDSFFINLTGDWITDSIKGPSSAVNNVSITGVSQNMATACGTIAYNGGQGIGFRMIFSMLENASMSYGMLMDEDGRFWTLSVKKGFIAMYDASLSGADVSGTGVYMVRNQGDTVVPAPMSVSGMVWGGTEGYTPNGTTVGIEGYSVEITQQDDCMISGKMRSGGNEYSFAGAFVVNIQSLTFLISAELRMNVNGEEVSAMLFFDENDNIGITSFDGSLPDGMISMEFTK